MLTHRSGCKQRAHLRAQDYVALFILGNTSPGEEARCYEREKETFGRVLAASSAVRMIDAA